MWIAASGRLDEAPQQYLDGETRGDVALDGLPRLATVAQRAQHRVERALARRADGGLAEDGEPRGAAAQAAQEVAMPEPARLDEGLGSLPGTAAEMICGLGASSRPVS